MDIEENDILVSVRLMTFNHASFIEEAMKGILSQKTTFKVEIVIGDDFSEDETLRIVKNFKENERIVINILNRRVGGRYWRERKLKGRLYNFQNIVENCNGKYIALLDGDDYWIDENKLQKQVDFLEKHQAYGGVATNSIVRYDNKADGVFGIRPSRKVKLVDMLLNRQFHTGTFLFRNNITFPSSFVTAMAGDTPLFTLVALKAPIYYLDQLTTVYRRGAHGLTANHESEKMKKVKKDFLLYLNDLTDGQYQRELLSTKKSLMSKANRFMGDKLERLYFFIFPTDQRHIFDIKHLSAFLKIYYRIKYKLLKQ